MYHPVNMIRKAAVTILELVVVALAAYTFFCVPIGRFTLWHHTHAILSTQPAQQAAEDIAQAAEQLQSAVVEQTSSALSTRKSP